MSKIIVYNIPSSGHINPVQGIVAELIRRGHHVIYFNTEETRRTIAQSGAEFRPYPTDETLSRLDELASAGIIADNALSLVHIAERLMPSVIETLRTEKPDLVLHDSLAGWGKQAAELLHIPGAALLTTFALNMRSMPAVSPLSMLRMMRDIVVRLPRYNQVAGRMQENFGVKNYGLTGALMSTNDLNIVFTSRLFQPAASTFDESYHFVGPSITERADTSAFPFDQLKHTPLIYISLGTINNQNLDFYRVCFEAFRTHPGQVVLSAGKHTDLTQLGSIPANFIVRNFVPQLEILKRADVFITHGGMNSVHEALWYGVPLVSVPQQLEQGGVAAQVAKHEAGVMAAQPGAAVTAQDLRAAVDVVLERLPTYQAAAKRLGESFRAAGGAVEAVNQLERYIATPARTS